MKTLTNKELTVMKAFIQESFDCSGHFMDDNMSWNNAQDLIQVTDYNAQEIGGIMSALEEKGLIEDSGESPRGAKVNDFYARPDECLKYSELVEFINSFK